MDTMTELLKKLDALDGGEIVRLSKASGVPYNTILNIKKGVTGNPRIKTAEALIAALKARGRRAAKAVSV